MDGGDDGDDGDNSDIDFDFGYIQVWVYRLACLEEANVALGREQLKQHALEQVDLDDDLDEEEDDLDFAPKTDSMLFFTSPA